MYKQLTKLLLVIAAIGLIVGQGAHISKLKDQRDAARHNVEVLTGEVEVTRTANGELSARCQSLELTQRDFERVMTEDAALIKELKNRNEKLSRLVNTQAETRVEFQTIIRDSIVYVDRILDTLKVVEWKDAPWEFFRATIQGDSMDVTMQHHEEIKLALLLEYKRFLWWKTKVKGCNASATSLNPYTSDITISSISIH